MKRRTGHIAWLTICLLLVSTILGTYPFVSTVQAETAIPTPSPPTVSSVGDGTSLQVAWSNTSMPDVVTGFVVYRSRDDLNFQVIKETDGLETVYTDTGLQSGQTYYYRIAAKDAEGNTSTPTASVSAEPSTNDEPPAMPAGFKGQKQGGNFVLTWEKNMEADLAGYQLYRSEDGINYSKVHPDLLADNQYVDTDLNLGKAYYYRVSAVDQAANESLLSLAISTEMDAFTSDRNVMENSHFQSDTSGWQIGSYQLYNDPAGYSEASWRLTDTGYTGEIKNAGHVYSGQGKAVEIEVEGKGKKARTTLYQRKVEIVPTGEPVQFSFAWKKNCACKGAAKQEIRVEIARPDSTWVTVWKNSSLRDMAEYSVVENLNVTGSFKQAGTYDIRIVVELWTDEADAAAVNRIYADEVFLDLPRGPKVPQGLQADVMNEGKALHVSWTPNSEADVQGYNLYRSTAEKGTYVLVNSQPIRGTSYDDKGLANGQTYYYRLKAVGSGVESIGSRAVRGVPTMIDPLNHPHHTYTSNTNVCASCHINHKAKNKAKTLLKQDSEAKICLTCHNGTGSTYNTQGQFTASDKSAHPIAGAAPASAGSMECSSCHNPHATNGTRNAPPKAVGSLAQVSGFDLQYDATPFTNPVSFAGKPTIEKETELCLSCHSTNPKSPVKTETTATAKEFHPGNLSGHNNVALSQSSGFGKYVNGWSATSQMFCTDCHGAPASPDHHQGVHGSPNSNLLKKEFSYQTKANTNPNALCFECHDRRSYGGNPNKDASYNTIGETRFKRKTGTNAIGAPVAGENLHNFWNETTNSGHLGVACAQCHSAVPHGTGKLPAMLVESGDPEPYQMYQTNTNVKIYYPTDGDWTNKNSCATSGAGCHLSVE